VVDRGGTTQRLRATLAGATLMLASTSCAAASPSVSASVPASVSAGPIATTQASPVPLPAWTTTGSLLEARWSHAATLLQDGRVLVAGGNIYPGGDSEIPASDFLASAEVYDPQTGSWTGTGAMTEARGGGHSATVLQDGKVLVAGGNSISAPFILASAELYDPATGTWTATGRLSAGRSGHTATLLPDGRVLVVGGDGMDPYGPLATAELYDPEGGSWSATGSMATVRIIHTATLLPDGTVLVAGGQGNDGSGPTRSASDALASAELYNPATGAWTAVGNLTEGRAGHTATLLPDGTVLVAGGVGLGSDATPYNVLATAELYDPASERWVAAAQMIAARAGHTATALSDGRVLLVGTGVNFSGVLAETEVFDSDIGSWSSAGSLIESRSFLTATRLTDGRVLLAGGGDIFASASAELYDPGGGTE